MCWDHLQGGKLYLSRLKLRAVYLDTLPGRSLTDIMSTSYQDASSSQQGHAAYPIAPGGYAQPPTEPSQSSAQPGGSGASGSTQPQSRQAAEEARKDRTLAEFMLMLDDYEPLVRIHYSFSS